jgi:hypothetical protein
LMSLLQPGHCALPSLPTETAAPGPKTDGHKPMTATMCGEDRTCRRHALSSFPTDMAALSLEGCRTHQAPQPTVTTVTMRGFSGMFSRFLYHFFLLSSSLAARSLRSTFLANGHGPTRPHNRWPRRRQRMVRTGHVDTDMPTPRRVLAPARAALPCSLPAARTVSLGLCHCMRMSLCPSQLCAPRCLAPRSCTHRVAVLGAPFTGLFSACMHSFFFFLLTSSLHTAR